MILEEYKIMEGFTGKATDQTFTSSGKFRLLFLNPTKQYTYPTQSTFKIVLVIFIFINKCNQLEGNKNYVLINISLFLQL